MKPLTICIGYDHAESVAFHVLCHSIWRRTTVPVQIIPIMLSQLGEYMWRDRDPMQSNEFAFSRWLTPMLVDYDGPVLWMDCDMLVLDDIANLFALYDPTKAVQVVKHNHQPVEEKKYLGNLQTRYEKKNWSSVMLFNAGHPDCMKLTPDYVNTAHGLDLHQFKWISDESLIGEIPLRWNFLVDYYDAIPVEQISNLHFTIGGPYFEDYRDCDYADVWHNEYADMIHSAQPVTLHYSEVAERIK